LTPRCNDCCSGTRYAVRAGSLAVARQGKLLFAAGYTWAESDYPVTQADSPFRLASVSKAFTAAVIYQLLQAKKLELSLPVFPWLGLDRAALPGQTVDPRLATITVEQLINHRGGWDSRAANFGFLDAAHRPQAWPPGRCAGGAKAMGEASNDIKRVLDSMPPVESSTTR
jgi:CubicO group peptidase (beta-lactamase class C family)